MNIIYLVPYIFIIYTFLVISYILIKYNIYKKYGLNSIKKIIRVNKLDSDNIIKIKRKFTIFWINIIIMLLFILSMFLMQIGFFYF